MSLVRQAAALAIAAMLLTSCATATTGPASRAGGAMAPGANDVVATVNGAPIVGAELARAMNTARAGVAASNGGRIAADRLREEGLTLAVQDKVLRLWAHEAGLLADVSEAGFAAALTAENRRREQARASGRPLPGVPSYDEYTYAGLRAAELKKALADRIDLPAGRVRAHYKELIKNLPGRPPTFEESQQRVRLSLAEREFTRELARRVATATVVP